MEQKTKNIGQNDAKVTDYIGNVVENIASVISHKLHPMIEQYAQLFAHGDRTPVLRRPDEYGMEYEDVFFPSLDGVPLEGWYIPTNSNKLLIINHPMPCNRYGYPGHLPPWNIMFGGFEVNFLPELKHLHDAGYNILTYDLRNHGLSGQGNGGISGLGQFECRDVVGSVRYAKSRKDLADMTVGIYSRCMGSISTVMAMAKFPEDFTNIKAALFLNIVSARSFIEAGAEMINADPDKAAQQLDERLHQLTGFHLKDETPTPYAKYVKVPTMMVQLRRDFLVKAEKDGNEIFEALGTEEKELLWIEESNQRFYAYNHFGQHPEKLINWFNRYMK
ncbi:alpha/beta hydrolase family protein [Chryseobacterium sp. T20]|uniref:alpha/beta hydrolase family protein n=1 Tax=Chryseobacterium sp. T20 TaxID=3395375 RepID=UPI0039BCB787